MIKKTLATLIIIFLSGSFIQAQPGETGVGLMIGSPSGFSAKHWLNRKNAIAAGLGFSLINDTKINLHIDYLYHLYDQFESDEEIPVYYGFGARILTKHNKEGVFGIRGIAGLNWFPKTERIDVFFEIAPIFVLLPEAAMDMDASLGVRYYFK